MRGFTLLILILGLINITTGMPTSRLDNRTNNQEFEILNATMISSSVVNSTISQINPIVSSTSLLTTTEDSRKKFLSDPFFWLPVSIIILFVLLWTYFRKEEEEEINWGPNVGTNVYNGGGYPPNNYANSGAYAYGDLDFRDRMFTSVMTSHPYGRELQLPENL
ncbi:Protein CBG17129 [Caenorhabditis briggsae]|uniref:Uncharacterized protein n=2 Tax=Caenorhabditis briggsae TaxID=6238 RepID=A0AAE9JQL2_CAEBR|nr:Protein CBG17129 [Caenorhabditis briggsae]ULT81429.1 hypothetical protein L3Y34_011377 [Caenorhabditis briggsae]UMM40724.1 hypothetical protein L5515_017242 [Caenorhabditis briggsae]UMM40736.1 hypothetical protein L5515_017253 [Caenorhabditis briggsae]CAP34974.1 Protein CBG17129 [Caenorhabditis briggsae]